MKIEADRDALRAQLAAMTERERIEHARAETLACVTIYEG
jgi:hypothetical protein